MLRQLIDTNRALCWKLEQRLPRVRVDMQRLFVERVAGYMNAAPGQVVVDVGGGKRCLFARHRDPASGTRIVALDVSVEELAHNHDVDERRVANIMEGLPFADEQVDLLASCSVLEHLESVDNFLSHAHRVLKPGGHMVHLIPSRFAPFAIANQLLPNKLSRRLIAVLDPVNRGLCGFPAHYHRCCHSAMTAALRERGFELVDAQVSYYQSSYAQFLLPLFLLSIGYDLLAQRLGAKDLAATLLLVARKPRRVEHQAQERVALPVPPRLPVSLGAVAMGVDAPLAERGHPACHP